MLGACTMHEEDKTEFIFYNQPTTLDIYTLNVCKHACLAFYTHQANIPLLLLEVEQVSSSCLVSWSKLSSISLKPKLSNTIPLGGGALSCLWISTDFVEVLAVMDDCAGTSLLTAVLGECVPDEWERLCPRWNSELTEDLRASTIPLSLPAYAFTYM